MSSIWLSNAFSSVPYWLFLQGLLSEKPKKRRLYCNLGDQDRFFCSGSASSLYQRILKMGCGDPLHTVKIGLCVFGNVRLGLHPWWQGLHFHKVFHKIFLKFQVFGLQKLMVFHWSGPFPYAGKNSWSHLAAPWQMCMFFSQPGQRGCCVTRGLTGGACRSGSVSQDIPFWMWLSVCLWHFWIAQRWYILRHYVKGHLSFHEY